MIVLKTPAEIDKMAAAGDILVRTLDMVAKKIRPDVTTADLDETAEKFIRSQGAIPAFKGYRGFPGSICASPNSMVVHGIPGPTALKRGDVISIDVGVTLDGWVADAARTFTVGPASDEAARLLSTTEAALHAGAAMARPGGRLGDISNAIQTRVEADGMSVVKGLVGHGIGRDMHEPPEVPNEGPAGKGELLEEGMVLAIEPMVSTGGPQVRMDDDGWSVFTTDGSLSAHFEFTVAVTAAGPRILTPWHDPTAGPKEKLAA